MVFVDFNCFARQLFGFVFVSFLFILDIARNVERNVFPPLFVLFNICRAGNFVCRAQMTSQRR